jgi:hypothetical protein
MSTRFLQKFGALSDIRYTANAAGIAQVGTALYANLNGSLVPIGNIGNGVTYYVDVNEGSNAATIDGKSWETAFLTMAYAFTKLASGDTIIFRGKVKEQVTTPVQVFDVTIIGAGNRPRHADDTPTGGETAANTWTIPASPTPTTPLVTVLQQGWRFINILFAGPTDDACIVLFRDAGAGNAERDASHAEILGCRFASGLDGIHIVEVSNVLIEGCQFHDLTGHAVKGVAGSGIANPLRGRFLDNIVTGCANGFYVSCNQWVIRGNVFDDGGTPTTTVVLSTAGSGAGAANSFVVGNILQVATANFNSPDVVGSAGDVWTGNMTPDAANAGASGIYEIGSPA